MWLNYLPSNWLRAFLGWLADNRCRFWKGCEHYRKDSVVCNEWGQRFPSLDGPTYCGKYRALEELLEGQK